MVYPIHWWGSCTSEDVSHKLQWLICSRLKPIKSVAASSWRLWAQVVPAKKKLSNKWIWIISWPIVRDCQELRINWIYLRSFFLCTRLYASRCIGGTATRDTRVSISRSSWHCDWFALRSFALVLTLLTELLAIVLTELLSGLINPLVKLLVYGESQTGIQSIFIINWGRQALCTSLQ